MPQYQIELPHTEEDCSAAINMVVTYGMHLMNHTWFGCDSGVHTGWLNLEVNNELDARRILPHSLRNQARVIEVRKFTTEEVQGGN